MTYTETIESLRCCFGFGTCSECKVKSMMEEDPLQCKLDCKERLGLYAADLIERLTAENAKAEAERDALREKVPQWVSVEDRLPAELLLVNVVWVNRAPEPYYEKIKDVPFSGTACFYRDRWYWDSPVVLDLLAEYGADASDLVDDAVEITHWMSLPEAPEGGEKA